MLQTHQLSTRIKEGDFTVRLQGLFAQSYNNNNYNNYTYGADSYGQAPFNGEVSQASSGLVNTGSVIGLGMLVGAVIVITTVISSFKRKQTSNTTNNK